MWLSKNIWEWVSSFQYYEGIRAAWLAKKSGQSYHHPFDIGVYKNITLVSVSFIWIIKEFACL